MQPSLGAFLPPDATAAQHSRLAPFGIWMTDDAHLSVATRHHRHVTEMALQAVRDLDAAPAFRGDRRRGRAARGRAAGQLQCPVCQRTKEWWPLSIRSESG